MESPTYRFTSGPEAPPTLSPLTHLDTRWPCQHTPDGFDRPACNKVKNVAYLHTGKLRPQGYFGMDGPAHMLTERKPGQLTLLRNTSTHKVLDSSSWGSEVHFLTSASTPGTHAVHITYI